MDAVASKRAGAGLQERSQDWAGRPRACGAALAGGVTALLCAALALPLQAQTPVSASEQAVRDGERLRILQAELAAEESRAAEAARRRAERLASGDAPGALEAEQAQQRARANVAALQREIGLAGRPQAIATTRRAAPAGVSRAVPARPSAPPAAQPPWWDVYGRAPRREGAVPAGMPAGRAPGGAEPGDGA